MTRRNQVEIRDWQRNRDMRARVLENQTGEGIDAWNRRIKKERLDDEQSLRAWLAERGVTGYAQSLLVMERFGYPDFVRATAAELIEKQYSDRYHLKPVYEAVVAAVDSEVLRWLRHTYIENCQTR